MELPTYLTIRHLRAFVALSEELHFARAAARLHLTSPALSQTLRQLEVAIGTTLVQRTTRSVELTPAGQAVLEHARAALTAFDSALAYMQRAARGEVGDLVVGYVIGAGLELMPSIVRAFERDVPDVRLELREYDFTNPAAGLDANEVDVAFVRPPLDIENLQYLDLLTEPRVACLPEGHRLAQRRQIRVAEILDEPIIAAPSRDPVWRDYWILVPERGGTPPNVVQDAATFEGEFQAIASGRGISVTGATSARYYARPGIRFVLIEDLSPCHIGLAWRPERAWAAVERLAAIAERERGAYVREHIVGPDGQSP
jgi:DNA-binding transcriptional LysR family regulator